MSFATVARSQGFTLIELIVSMLLISIAALGVLYAFSFSAEHQSDAMWQAKSVALAEAYVEEILARPYDEATPNGGTPPCTASTTPPCSGPGPDAGETTRADFDDVDDYDGLVESPPLDADGNARAGYDGFTVTVMVRYADAGEIGDFGLDDGTDAKRIEVAIASPGDTTLRFAAYRGNF